MSSPRSEVVVAAALLALACAGKTEDGGGAGGAAGTGGSGATGGGGGTTCPATPPAFGDPCTAPWANPTGAVGAHCSWGDDARPHCRTAATCGGDGTWMVVVPDLAQCAPPPVPAGCEPRPTPGTACDDPALACWYEDGARCWCSPCRGGSEYPVCQDITPPEWACVPPREGCPAVVPQAGSPCAEEGLSCGPDCEREVRCVGGVWQWLSGNCPICASPDTPVATPEGERPIASLRVGDLVYSVENGEIVTVPIVEVGSTPVVDHRVVRVTLEGGEQLELSPGHPMSDGRTFRDLAAGAELGAGRRAERVELVPYRHARTHDVLPATTGGTYFAAGVELGSTLRSVSAPGDR